MKKNKHGNFPLSNLEKQITNTKDLTDPLLRTGSSGRCMVNITKFTSTVS